MKRFLLPALAALLSLSSWADTNETKPDAKVILDRVLANRPMKNFSFCYWGRSVREF